MENLELFLRPVFRACCDVLYLGLAIYVARSSSSKRNNSIIAFFLFLIGVLVAGTAFSFGTQDPNIYGIGRVLSFFASGFLPIAFYFVYREYTVGAPGPIIIAMLSIIPIATTVLALTNSVHNIIWSSVVTTPKASSFPIITEHYWFTRVHAPFMYGLFVYTVISLASRLPSIAPAHRRTIVVLIVCAVMPFAVSVGSNFLGLGSPEFPMTSLIDGGSCCRSTGTPVLPCVSSISVRLAYETLFHHVRDPIVVLGQ